MEVKLNYRVKSDEEFFNEFSYLGSRVKSMAYLFQNQDTYTFHEEIEEWNNLMEMIIGDIIHLKNEGLSRIEKIKS